MEKKNYLILDNEFLQFCKLNNIDDIERYAKKVFDIGFTTIKYDRVPKIEMSSKIEEIKQENKLEKKATSLYDE